MRVFASLATHRVASPTSRRRLRGLLVACTAVAVAGPAAASVFSPGLDATRLRAARGVGATDARPGAPSLTLEPKSNMGFKLVTSYDALEGYRNLRFVSVPFFHELDVADSSLDDPCDTTAGDGVLDPHDLLCDWWSSRQGGMIVSRWDVPTQSWESRLVRRDETSGEVVFEGPWTDPLVPREAFAVTAIGPESGSATNAITITGSHDPSAPPVELVPLPGEDGPTQYLLNLVYHVMYRDSVEILCGLARVSWSDVDGDGWPDTCDGGIFDPESGALVSIGTFDDDPSSATADTFVSLSVHRDETTGELVFEGVNDPLVPGRAYLVHVDPAHGGASYLAPHF